MIRVVASYVVLPYKPGLSWDSEAGKTLLKFGKYIFINTIVTWAAFNLDRMIIGKSLGMEVLGSYNIALYIGVFITEVMVQIFTQSYFPLVSRIGEDLAKVRRIYRKTMTTISTLALPLVLLMTIFSDELISLLYDPRYHLAGVALFWISLRSAVQIIANIQSGTMLALGHPKLVTISNAIGLTALVMGLIGLTPVWGLTGAGVAILTSSIISGGMQTFYLVRRISFQADEMIIPWLRLLVYGMVIFGTHTLGEMLFPVSIDPNYLLIVLTTAVSFLLIYLLTRASKRYALFSTVAIEDYS